MAEYFIVPVKQHNQLISTAFRHRGFDERETEWTVRLCEEAARHGIHTHNAIKALHLDNLFGTHRGGCVPGAEIEVLPSKFPTAEVWDCHKKIGPAVAYPAIETCIRLAEEYGVGMVSVDNAFHYFWGGAYVLEAARRGYIAYTNCTATLAEVVPFGGRSPSLGTNPHSWAFPTTEAIGYPVLVDWATSSVAMGRVQQLRREGRMLPPNCAVDASGNPTQNSEEAVALLPFGAHKGYGLGLIDELVAAFIGGWIPTARGRSKENLAKDTTCFFFQVIHPDAIKSNNYQSGTVEDNIKAVLEDIRGHENTSVLFPGQIEAEWAQRSENVNGLCFSDAEINAFSAIAQECGCEPWNREAMHKVILD